MVALIREPQPAFSPTCREAALLYAQQGLPVFPVQGKIPYPRTRGFHDATTDPDLIGWWWRRWPDANVAVPTGSASGWVVLDIDGRHGGFASFEHLKAMLHHRLLDLGLRQPALPATRSARTGSGLHLIFQPPTAELRNTVHFAGFPGIDLRGDGGYIVVAPSRHPNGRRYCWQTLLAPAPFPYLLLGLLLQQERLQRLETSRRQQASPSHQHSRSPEAHRTSDPAFWLRKAVQLARVGTRHTYALWLACRLIEQVGLTPQEAEPYLRQYVDLVPGGHKDYPLSDALHCLDWAGTHMTKPISTTSPRS